MGAGQKFIELCKTITINVLGFNWFAGDQRYHHTFHIREDVTGQLLSDDLEIHFLELEKVKGLKRRSQDTLEAWLMYLNNLEGEAMEAIAVENPAIKKALTIEEAFWRSERERRLYELREKALRDEIVMMDGARAEGKAEMAQEAICRYLEVRFGEEVSLGLREKVKKCTNLDMLDKIMNKIYTASSLEDARAIIEGVPGA